MASSPGAKRAHHGKDPLLGDPIFQVLDILWNFLDHLETTPGVQAFTEGSPNQIDLNLGGTPHMEP